MKKIIRIGAIRKTLAILLGNFIAAVAVTLFFAPQSIALSGVAGLGLLLSRLFPIPAFVFVLLSNLLLLFISLLLLGRKFFFSTVLSSVLYPAFIGVLSFWLPTPPTVNSTVSVAFGGILLGVGVGLVLRAGASTGGMDIPALLLHRFLRLPLSASVLIADAAVLTLSLVGYPLESVLEGALAAAIQALVIERVVLFGSAKMQIKVVTNSVFLVADAIMRVAERGVTLLAAETGYLHRETKVVLTVLSARQLSETMRAIHEVDRDAFIIVNRVAEVYGRFD